MLNKRASPKSKSMRFKLLSNGYLQLATTFDSNWSQYSYTPSLMTATENSVIAVYKTAHIPTSTGSTWLSGLNRWPLPRRSVVRDSGKASFVKAVKVPS